MLAEEEGGGGTQAMKPIGAIIIFSLMTFRRRVLGTSRLVGIWLLGSLVEAWWRVMESLPIAHYIGTSQPILYS